MWITSNNRNISLQMLEEQLPIHCQSFMPSHASQLAQYLVLWICFIWNMDSDVDHGKACPLVPLIFLCKCAFYLLLLRICSCVIVFLIYYCDSQLWFLICVCVLFCGSLYVCFAYVWEFWLVEKSRLSESAFCWELEWDAPLAYHGSEYLYFLLSRQWFLTLLEIPQ